MKVIRPALRQPSVMGVVYFLLWKTMRNGRFLLILPVTDLRLLLL